MRPEGERAAEAAAGGEGVGQRHAAGGGAGNWRARQRRRRAVRHLQGRFRVSERRACRLTGQHRSSQRYCRRLAAEEALLHDRLRLLARVIRATATGASTSCSAVRGGRATAKATALFAAGEGVSPEAEILPSGNSDRSQARPSPRSSVRQASMEARSTGFPTSPSVSCSAGPRGTADSSDRKEQQD
jgi:hypothetical protein